MVEPEAEKLSLFSVLVGPFIVATCSGVAYLPGWNYLIKGMGAVLAIAFVIRSLRAGVRPSTEVFLYGLWVVWCMTGVLTSVQGIVFRETWMSVFQIFVLILIISGFVDSRKALTFNLVAFFLGAAIAGTYSVITGEYQRFEVAGTEEARAGSFLGSNGFGYLMLLATVVMAYLWMLPTRFKRAKIVLLSGGIITAALFAISSGSRKAILSLGLFYISWAWFCYRKEVFRRPLVFLAALLALGVGGVKFVSMIQESPVAERFAETWAEARGRQLGGGGVDIRLTLYREAFSVFKRHPIIGAGLNQFRFHSSTGMVTHSDFMGVITNTGLLGFLLYFGIFAALWWRAGSIIKNTRDPTVEKIAQLIRVMIIVVLAMALGRSNYRTKEFWVLVASFIGWVQYQHLRLKKMTNMESYEVNGELEES